MPLEGRRIYNERRDRLPEIKSFEACHWPMNQLLLRREMMEGKEIVVLDEGIETDEIQPYGCCYFALIPVR